MKTVLVCPLDWGLGHASRDIPIVKMLISNGFNVIIGADNLPLQLLRNEFPHLKWIRIPSFVTIQYSKGFWLIFRMMLMLPKLFWVVYREHQFLKNILKTEKIDIVISDCRYGLWNKQIHSVFISHQIMIKLPVWLSIFEPILYRLNKILINQFNRCWIPDFEGVENLSGDLSHKYPKPENAVFIGILSKFTDIQLNKTSNKIYDFLVILSGPEPQRTIFEDIIVRQFQNTDYKTLIVQGKPNKSYKSENQPDNITFVNHLSTNELVKAIERSHTIISRAGYTSIMDYVELERSAILIPTSGQTEQEYLAKHLAKNSQFYFTNQHKFDLKNIVKKCCKSLIHINFAKQYFLKKEIESLQQIEANTTKLK